VDTETQPAQVQRTVTIATRAGLHARPAATVAKTAANLPIVVQIAKDGNAVDARSLLLLLSLGAEQGDTVTLSAAGDGAAEAVDALARLLLTEPDEDS
jgi:phosphocarrier protein HPr